MLWLALLCQNKPKTKALLIPIPYYRLSNQQGKKKKNAQGYM